MALKLDEIAALQRSTVEELASGRGRKEIIAQMVAQGIAPITAERIVTNAECEVKRQAQPANRIALEADSRSRRFIAGAILFLCGIGATLIGFRYGIGILWYGAVLWGAGMMIRARWGTHRSSGRRRRWGIPR